VVKFRLKLNRFIIHEDRTERYNASLRQNHPVFYRTRPSRRLLYQTTDVPSTRRETHHLHPRLHRWLITTTKPPPCQLTHPCPPPPSPRDRDPLCSAEILARRCWGAVKHQRPLLECSRGSETMTLQCMHMYPRPGGGRRMKPGKLSSPLLLLLLMSMSKGEEKYPVSP